MVLFEVQALGALPGGEEAGFGEVGFHSAISEAWPELGGTGKPTLASRNTRANKPAGDSPAAFHVRQHLCR